MAECCLCGKAIDCPVCEIPYVMGLHACEDCNKALEPLDRKINDPFSAEVADG